MFTVLAVFFVVMVIFLAQLVDLQAVRPDRYRTLAQSQSTTSRAIAGFRGRVLDREGFVLAASTPTQMLIADPQLVEDPVWTAALLAPLLEMDAGELEERLAPSSPRDRYNVVATTSDVSALAGIRALVADRETSDAFTGIVIRPEEDRLYPAGELASPLIGRVDPDEVGRSGVELQYDELLRGTAGVERFERGRFGSISVGRRSVEPAETGYDLSLTLDHRIQYGTEAILASTCERLGAAGASAIVSDPTSGEVYAMASVERSDDSTCGVASYNKAAIDTFEPGSVMKLVSFAAAADHLGYGADDSLLVPGSVEVADKWFFDHPRHDEQRMKLSEAMGQSSNVATITLSQQMGSDVYYDYATGFGFGSYSGLGVKGESTGVLRSPKEWLGSDAGSIVIGQGMTVNLMQLAGAFNTVGNDGIYTPAKLLLADPSVDDDGAVSVDAAASVAPRRVISSDAAGETLKMLTAVTAEGGTGHKASIEGYTVAGKTGTAWKVFDNGSGNLTYGNDNDRRYVTTFGGLVPAEAPELAVVLVIDEPRTATSATTAAAPTFAEIAQYALRVLKIAPVNGDGPATPARPEQRALVRGTPAEHENPTRSPRDSGSAPSEGEPAVDSGRAMDPPAVPIDASLGPDAEPPAIIEQPAVVVDPQVSIPPADDVELDQGDNVAPSPEGDVPVPEPVPAEPVPAPVPAATPSVVELDLAGAGG